MFKIRIEGLPGNTNKGKIRVLAQDLFKALKALGLVQIEEDVICYFPADLLPDGLGEAIFVSTDELLPDEGRSSDVLHSIAQACGTVVCRHFMMATIRSKVSSGQHLGYWHSPAPEKNKPRSDGISDQLESEILRKLIREMMVRPSVSLDFIIPKLDNWADRMGVPDEQLARCLLRLMEEVQQQVKAEVFENKTTTLKKWIE